MESFINDNFVAWASNIKYPQGYQVNNLLSATAYPYIAVLCCNPVGGIPPSPLSLLSPSRFSLPPLSLSLLSPSFSPLYSFSPSPPQGHQPLICRDLSLHCRLVLQSCWRYVLTPSSVPSSSLSPSSPPLLPMGIRSKTFYLLVLIRILLSYVAILSEYLLFLTSSPTPLYISPFPLSPCSLLYNATKPVATHHLEAIYSWFSPFPFLPTISFLASSSLPLHLLDIFLFDFIYFYNTCLLIYLFVVFQIFHHQMWE